MLGKKGCGQKGEAEEGDVTVVAHSFKMANRGMKGEGRNWGLNWRVMVGVGMVHVWGPCIWLWVGARCAAEGAGLGQTEGAELRA